jgi:hypothetical protein
MRTRWRRLVHDVGKYVARTARNLPDEPTPDLVEMLARDLYELPSGRASQVFEALAADLDGPAIAAVRALLVEADGLEPRLRAGERQAVRRGAALAREIEERLRAAVRE